MKNNTEGLACVCVATFDYCNSSMQFTNIAVPLLFNCALLGWQEGQPACKNFCFKSSWDIAMADIVNTQGTAWSR